MPEPRLSFLLLTRNGGPRFERVLAALFESRGIEECQVVMIDSGSTDGTWEVAAKFPQIERHRIDPGDFGHGRTRNLAAQLARADELVFLVQDAIPARGFSVENLVRRLAEEPDLAGIYGRQIARSDANPVEQFYIDAAYPETGDRASRKRDSDKIQSIFFSNVCSVIRREVLLETPFDESLIMSEDQRWAQEVRERGLRTSYEPSVVVEHSHAYSLSELFRRNFDSGWSLRGIVGDTLFDMVRYELGHLASGIRFLFVHRKPHWLPYFLTFESARVFGFACGMRAHWLPRSLRRRFSMHRYHWA